MAYPDEKPSEFLQYIFSPMGAAEWPPMSGGVEFSLEEEQMMRRAGQPFIPEGLMFENGQPSPAHGDQIVLQADDARGVIIAEAYADPYQPPIARREFEFRSR